MIFQESGLSYLQNKHLYSFDASFSTKKNIFQRSCKEQKIQKIRSKGPLYNELLFTSASGTRKKQDKEISRIRGIVIYLSIDPHTSVYLINVLTVISHLL